MPACVCVCVRVLSATRIWNRESLCRGTTMAMPISIESIEALLRLKLKERVAPIHAAEHRFRLFGRPENGITVDNFRKTLANLGVILSLEDAATIFRKYDRTNDGRVNFNEFLLDLFPRDFTGVSWNIRADQEMWLEEKQKKGALLHLQQIGMGTKPTKYPPSLRKNKMTLDELQHHPANRAASATTASPVHDRLQDVRQPKGWADPRHVQNNLRWASPSAK